MRPSACLAALGLLLAGCTVFQTRFAAPLEVDAAFAVGETSLEQVVAELGPPTSIGTLPEGAVVFYESAEILELQFGMGIIEYVKLAVGRGLANREEIVFTFDRAGLLTGQAADTRGENLGTGGAIQIAFAVASVVDTSDIHESLAPHGWGIALLRPIDETLNAAWDPRSGQSGAEQAGTTKSVGQRTLEWGSR